MQKNFNLIIKGRITGEEKFVGNSWHCHFKDQLYQPWKMYSTEYTYVHGFIVAKQNWTHQEYNIIYFYGGLNHKL